MTTVTVSMPYGRSCADTVRRAVDAVLAQTHTDLRLIVVNDGEDSPPWPMLADITDPRLVRLNLVTNRGRYHCDAVTLACCDTDWWTIHDADDAADPEWLASMLAAAADGADVVLAAQTVHQLNGRARLEPVKAWAGPEQLVHHAHMAGLWSPRWLRQVVGPHPGYRVGYDSLMTSLPSLLGARLVVVESPLYHRHRHRGSLTLDPATGTRSAKRRAATARLRDLWAQVVAAAESGPEAVGAVIEADVTAEEWAAVKTDVEQLRAALAGRDASAPAPAPSRYAADVCAEDGLWTGWALDRGTAAELDALLARRRPRVVVESGSGSSTVILARYALATGARVISLEHDPRYAARTLDLLARHVPGHTVDLRTVPLIDGDGGPWYGTALPDGIDVALVDGPPEALGGRAAALPALWPHLSPDAEIWLDDGARPGEQAAVEAWQTRYGVVHVEALPGAKRPVRILTAPEVRADVDAGDVAVTVLTGGRPHLLTRTLTALRGIAPGLLETAHVTVMNNGGDPHTTAVLDRFRDLCDQVIVRRSAPLGIGSATSRLARAAADTTRPYWLHLEDDWLACTGHDGWLDEARQVLAARSDVAQVRLRHRGERVLSWHMVTKAQLSWSAPRPETPALIAPAAHWTFNPALVRTRDLGRVYPAANESRAQRQAHTKGLRGVAQLLPGVFTHIGGGDESLRARTGNT